MSQKRVRNGLGIAICGLSGLAAGATLMYVLDPKSGARRRKRFGEAAHFAADYAQKAGSAVRTAGQGAREQIGGFRDQLMGMRRQRKQYAERLGHAYRKARDSASAYVEDLAKRGRERADDLSESMRARRDQRARGQSGSGMAKTISLSALGAAAIAGTAYYFFEPKHGRERRGFVMNKTGDLIRETGRLARATGNYFSGRREEPVDDLTLEGLVRSELEHSSDIGGLGVSVSDGIVTLTGHCEPGKLLPTVGRVKKMRGVRGVRNELRAYDLRTNAPPTARSAPHRSAM